MAIVIDPSISGYGDLEFSFTTRSVDGFDFGLLSADIAAKSIGEFDFASLSKDLIILAIAEISYGSLDATLTTREVPLIHKSYVTVVVDTGEEETPDSTRPEVSNFAPATSSILNRNDAVTFDVTDDSGSLLKIIVSVRFASGLEELAFDGTSFVGFYTESTRSSITDGYQFSLKRTNGWSSNIRIRVIALDAAGNEAR